VDRIYNNQFLKIEFFLIQTKKMADENSIMKNAIDKILKEDGVYELVSNPVFCVGGSLPTYIYSKVKLGKETSLIPRDIDIYTENHVLAIRHLLQNINKFKIISIGPGMITMKATRRNIHFIFAEAKSFMDDVLGLYDCSMVRIGYYPTTGEFIMHPTFLESVKQKKFVCDKNFTEEDRRIKLKQRAAAWYDSEIEFKNGTDPINYDDNTTNSTDIADLIYTNPPNYLQLFHNKYRCLICKQIADTLICQGCSKIFHTKHVDDCISGKTITVIGGINGFGKIISSTLGKKNKVFATGTNPDETPNTTKFQFNKPVNQKLQDFIIQSDICILNATKTLDNVESVWNTTLRTFDKNLLMDRVETNVCGYAEFIRELVKIKIKNTKPLTIVWIDANESKTKGKMTDGKHVELNVAKASVKQLLYTFADIFLKLGIKIILYDPGWMSYHGIELEKQKKDKLISPEIAIYGLEHYLRFDISGFLIHSVYEYILYPNLCILN
jgi:hypothetical protein